MKLKMKKSLKRHKWLVWLYSPTGRLGSDVPIKPGIVVNSRRRAKKIASKHSCKMVGNEGVWTRMSHSIRDRQAENEYRFFTDVTTMHHLGDGIKNRVLCHLTEYDFVMLMNCEYSRHRYARAAHNPAIIGERHQAVYRSTTLWQAESFCIEVQAGYFWTKEEADAFGKKPIRLVLDGGSRQVAGRGYLRFISEDGKPIETPDLREEWLDWLNDEDVSITKLKASSVGKLVTDFTDYEPVNILIEDFVKYPELSSFGMLSYGVKQVAELPI